MKSKTFDRFYIFRINVTTLQALPLRERKDDILVFCYYFANKLSLVQKKNISEITEEVLDVLMEHEFPGNVRELENIMERAITLYLGNRIEVQHLPLDLQQRLFHIYHPKRKELITLEEHEKEYIMWVLDRTHGNRSKTSAILVIDRVSIWRKIKKYDLALTRKA